LSIFSVHVPLFKEKAKKGDYYAPLGPAEKAQILCVLGFDIVLPDTGKLRYQL
jgi:hypothetical protein